MENSDYYVGWGTLALINGGLAQGKSALSEPGTGPYAYSVAGMRGEI